MKTEALLELLNLEENELYDSIKKKYEQRLEAIQKEERIKKMGGINPFVPKKTDNHVQSITSKELQEAWETIDTETKYKRFKGIPIQEEQIPEAHTPKVEPKKEGTRLTHLVLGRPVGAKGRRLPSHLQARIKKDSLPQETNDEPIKQAEVTQKTTENKTIKTELKPIDKKTELPVNAPLRKQPLSVSDLQSAVYTAVQNYTNYHSNSQNKHNSKYNRGQGDGIFSFFRHGAYGITTANKLYDSIKSKDATLDDTVKRLKDFLGHSSKAYHHHSFTSYLADALAEKGLITSHPTSRYSQKEVVNQLEQWMGKNLLSSNHKIALTTVR